MTRYLDREPQLGDHVRVSYEAEYDHVIPGGRHLVVVADDSGQFRPVAPPYADVRVIAPEPAVGDVVTEDMDLPHGSIVEQNTAVLAALESDGTWWMTATGRQAKGWHPGGKGWRIVRIGGAQ